MGPALHPPGLTGPAKTPGPSRFQLGLLGRKSESFRSEMEHGSND
jgi:hypothetical protein